MRQKFEKEIETLVYGILSLIFGMAFFFGVLYPDQGISPRAYSIKEMPVETEAYPEAKQGYVRNRWDLREEIYDCDKSKIRYRLYFYERLKNS